MTLATNEGNLKSNQKKVAGLSFNCSSTRLDCCTTDVQIQEQLCEKAGEAASLQEQLQQASRHVKVCDPCVAEIGAFGSPCAAEIGAFGSGA